MKYKFYATFAWDKVCAQWNPDPFEADSIEQVCSSVKSLMYSNCDALHSEDFFLEAFSINDKENDEELLDFHYDVKLRRNVLYNEEEEMLNELRKELKKEVFKDE